MRRCNQQLETGVKVSEVNLRWSFRDLKEGFDMNLEELRTHFALPEAPEPPEPNVNPYKNSTYVIVSSVAYLIGVPKRIFDNENEPPDIEIYNKLDNNKSARIIRNLCMLRTAVERNFGKINIIMSAERKGIAYMNDLVPVECIWQLSQDGISIKSFPKLNQHIIEFNRLISDRINNCKDIFPIWLNWQYIRDLFIMPDGLSEDGIKKAADDYYKYLSYYPYQVYINWPASDEGNILYNDKKFVTRLYTWNYDEFVDSSKVSDVSETTKSNIYEFLEESQRTVLVVDCENSDPYRLCATLRNLDEQYFDKIVKIILYDDVHTATAWRILDSYTGIPVEHILIERVKSNKSLVDISLTAGTCKEFYTNNVDSFVIVSSDSDYWALITAIPEARFLVMLEHEKTGYDIKNALANSGIFYCFIDDFYSGDSDEIKIVAMLNEVKRYLDRYVRINVNDMLRESYRLTRIEMSEAEQKRFYSKYIKPMHLEIDEKGNLTIQLKKK